MKQTIVLLDDSSAGAVELLTELSGQGMLHDCLVVGSDGRCTFLSNGELTEVNIGAHLAGRALTLVRVLHLSLNGEPVAAAHQQLVAGLDDTLAPVGIAVERASLVMPLDGATVSRGAFPQYWNYNLLVQPADMAGEAGFAVLPLTDPEKQLVVATACVALCGALWRWLDEGPLDGGRFRADGGGIAANSDADIGTARVRVVRATTRMVDAGDIAAQAVALALAPGVQFPPPAGCMRHGDAKQAIVQLAEQIAPQQGDSYFGFTYTPFVRPAPAKLRRMTPWFAIRSFMKEFWQQLRRMPMEAALRQWDRIKKAVEDSVSAGTYGADSDIKVSFDRTGALEVAVDPNRRSEAIAALPNLTIGAPAAVPAVWSGLMSVVLGAVDGNDFPDGCGVTNPDWSNHRAVIGDPASMAHPTLANPEGGRFAVAELDARQLGWSTDGPLTIGGVDPVGAQAVLQRIAAHTSTAAPGEALPPPNPDDPSAPPPAKAPKELPKNLETLQSRLQWWIAEREKTLLWRIAQSLATQQDHALNDLAQTSAELEQVLQEMQNAEATERKSRRRFFWKALGILLLLALLIAAFVLGVLFVTAVSLVFWIAGLTLGLVGIVWAMVRTAGRRVREQHRRDQISRKPQLLMEQRRTAAQEFVRLSSLYMQFQDWAEVAAVALHRPLGNVQHQSEKPWATTVGALSFVCGVPKLDDDRIRATTLNVLQHLATKGWLTRAYERQRQYILDEYVAVAGGIAATDVPPEADNSIDQGVLARLPTLNGGSEVVVYPPRANLRLSYAAGRWASKYRSEQVDAMQDTVIASDPFGMIESIGCDVVGLNAPKRNPKGFLAPVVEWNAVPSFDALLHPKRRLQGLAVRSVVGISDGLDAELLANRSATVPVMPLRNRFTLASFRLDISDALDLHDVVIIEGSAVKHDQVADKPTPTDDEITPYG